MYNNFRQLWHSSASVTVPAKASDAATARDMVIGNHAGQRFEVVREDGSISTAEVSVIGDASGDPHSDSLLEEPTGPIESGEYPLAAVELEQPPQGGLESSFFPLVSVSVEPEPESKLELVAELKPNTEPELKPEVELKAEPEPTAELNSKAGPEPKTLPELSTVLIEFAFDSAELSSVSQGILDATVEQLLQYSALSAVIQGFSDKQGEPSYNLELARKRAVAVAEYMVKAGVDAGRFSVEGRGTDYTLENNSSPITVAPQQLERRVVQIDIRHSVGSL